MRRTLGIILIVLSTSIIMLLGLLIIFSVIMNSLIFDTTLVDSCRMGNSRETVRLYYTATILDASWSANYQARPLAPNIHIVGVRTYPEISQIECFTDSVVIMFEDHREEISRQQFLDSYVYYRRSVRSVEPQYHPSILDVVFDWLTPFGWFLPLILMLLIGRRLAGSGERGKKVLSVPALYNQDDIP